MNYKLEKPIVSDVSKLIDYKLRTIFEYAGNLPNEAIARINEYVKKNVPMQLENYKIICVNYKKVGCLLVESTDDGVLVDEIYLEKNYRNQGIGTDIIKEIISKNGNIYLWVYKLNEKAISLYKRLGFKIKEETETRYYMKYSN